MNKTAKSLILTFCVISMTAPSFAADTAQLTVSRLGDTELSCDELSLEADHMQEIISTKQDIRDETKMRSAGIGVAGTAAGFLIGTVTGGLGLAAAGYLAKEANEEKGDKAENLQDVAEQRRALMKGIFEAKGCEGPIQEKIPATQEAFIVPPPLPEQKSAPAIKPASGVKVAEASYNK